MINFSVYTYQGICAKHGIITNGPTLFKVSKENDDINNNLIKRPTYGNKLHLTKISYCIGEFHMVNHQPMLKKCEYHMMLMYLFRKHECNKLRIQAIFF